MGTSAIETTEEQLATEKQKLSNHLCFFVSPTIVFLTIASFLKYMIQLRYKTMGYSLISFITEFITFF